ncbi:MAG TPA: autoinducer binding domain-containing protein, partial [Patescibacteria group bacterium]|nr:autoinducer binding domain-containing protein [Patescibacteria group bacterium]
MLEDFVIQSTKVRSVNELFDVYKSAMAGLGFDRVIFSLMTDHLDIKRVAGHGIISNYPDDWMKYYIGNNYANTDPVRGRMFAAPGPFLWEECMDPHRQTSPQIKLMNESREAGLHQGIGIPLRGARGAVAGIGAASSNKDIDLDPVTVAKANMLSAQFYAVFTNL